MDALLVVHMQVGLLADKPKHDLHGVLDRINRLAAKVRAASGQVILIQHCGGEGDAFEPEAPGWKFLPELVREPEDIVLPTTLNDPFCRNRPSGTIDCNSAGPGHCDRLGH